LSLEVYIWHVVVKGQVALCGDLRLQYLEGNGRCVSPRTNETRIESALNLFESKISNNTKK
jgi:hypothetical protein